MSKLIITCKTASTQKNGVEIKPSITLLESTVYLDNEKIPSKESIENLKKQYSHIAALYSLPEGEVCTCEIEMIE